MLRTFLAFLLWQAIAVALVIVLTGAAALYAFLVWEWWVVDIMGLLL